MKSALGIDIGGTKIAVSFGLSNGKILGKKIIPTEHDGGPKKAVNALVQVCHDLVSQFSNYQSCFVGSGVGIPGAVDDASGIVPKSPNMKNWAGIPLKKILQSQIKCPVVMGNDANTAALGEKHFGTAKGVKNFAYITISTGIGSGIVINNQLMTGISGMAGEVGHMAIVVDGRLCKCGGRGCLEAYSSGTGIASIYNEELRRIKKNAAFLEAREIAQKASAGDKLAAKVFEKAGYHLGIGLSNMMHLFNPSLIVLGGGVLNSTPKVFWTAMEKSCKEKTWPVAFKACKIAKSKIHANVGDLGALALAFETF